LWYIPNHSQVFQVENNMSVLEVGIEYITEIRRRHFIKKIDSEAPNALV